jgi:NAD(P)-dependent dehydrogenase (short-subunit alcohol dehydrogenase family)
MSNPDQNTALVIGASSAIAQAIILKLMASNSPLSVVAISRSPNCDIFNKQNGPIRVLQSDYSEESIAKLCELLWEEGVVFSRIFICNGILHQEEIFPEKRLQDLRFESLSSVMHVNAFAPILWLKHLSKFLRRTRGCVVTVFSARVGSIDDNRAGGWYSYRASKAALNMLLKTAAIECRRFSPSTRFLAFHPGTTDTELSKPFQKAVRPDSLFSPEFVADRLLGVIENLPEEPALNFLDWEGKPVAW